MKELKNRCPNCGVTDKMELVVDVPTILKVSEDGKVNFSVRNNTMINKIDDLLNKFEKYSVHGHCSSCDKNCKCIITKDKKIIFVKEKDMKNE